ncbi:MAG: 4'-phosphopantetheinyl transferase superfamily protein [Bacteroidetes bacterium]|nr:4'-phosphopantetheinyl transferase superfamily protein [Bacteroidota bacterium]
MKVYHLNINVLKVKPIHEWLSEFPELIQDDILQYKKEKDQWRVLGGKWLLQNMLNANRYTFTLEQLKSTSKGKLYFDRAKFDFNISHSGEIVVLAVVQDGMCGIDIELHRAINYSIFERNFTPIEWKTIVNAKHPSQQFFDYWAIKESVIKADGRGFEVLGKTEILSVKQAVCHGRMYHISPVYIEKGYSSCVASDKKIKQIEIIDLSKAL